MKSHPLYVSSNTPIPSPWQLRDTFSSQRYPIYMKVNIFMFSLKKKKTLTAHAQ